MEAPRCAVWLLTLLLAACQHKDAPPPETRSSAADAPRDRVALDAPPSTGSDVPGCLWPMAASPPPQAAPADSCPPAPQSLAPLTRSRLVFTDTEGQPSIELELAQTNAERERGLMYRTELGAGSGMLFVWEQEELRSFWMRNTCVPLDMLFIDAQNRIVGILEQVPVLNEQGRSVPCPARFVLEVNAGFCRAHGVRPGQHIHVSLPS